MTKKGYTHYLLIVLLTLTPSQCFTQCQPSSDYLIQLSNIQSGTQGNTEKIFTLRKLQELYLKCNKTTDSIYARIIHRLGDIYRLSGDLNKGILYTKAAVLINTSSDKAEKSYLANSYFNLGLYYGLLYLYPESHHYFDSCIAIGLQFKEKAKIVIMAFEQNAFLYYRSGDYQQSINMGEKGVLLANVLKDTLYQGSLFSQIAQAQTELGLMSQAELNIKKAISILENVGMPKYLASAYSIYANLLITNKSYDSAINYYTKASQLNLQQNNLTQCSRDFTDLGLLYDTKLNNGNRAIACYQKAIKLLQNINDPYQLVAIYINSGVVYWNQKKYQIALAYYQKALNTLPIHFTDTSIKSNPTENQLRLVANDYFVSTLLSNKGEALLALYKQQKRKDLLLNALNTYQVADKAVDLMRWKQLGEQSKLFWREKTKKMYENAIEVCYLLNDAEKAYYFFEKSRAVLLNDKLSELGAKKFIAAADRTKEEQLRIKVFSLKQHLSFISDTASNYNNIKQDFLSAQQEWENFIRSLEKTYPLYYQYKYNDAVAPLSSVKAVLQQNNQSLIEFFTADSVIYVLHLSPAGSQVLKINFKEYGAVAKELMTLCSDRSLLNQNYPRYQQLAYRLYDRLLKPLQIKEGRVIISPDDYFLPVEALLSDSTNATSFLLKKYAFSYAYSMGLLLKANTNTAASSNSFLGIAPINYQSYLKQASLAGADLSLKKIEPYFQSTSMLLNKDATKEAFLNNLSSYKTVQIYSHADADSSGKQPVLYLYDSVLNLSEIQILDNLQTDMIVLSACNTGIGKQAKGEGVFSLARAFMAVGIPSTVTTLWQIDNNATYQLTESFYKYLSQGLPKDVAMQKAKLEFISNGDKTYELPYFWAAAIVLGKTTNTPIDITRHKSFPLYMLIPAIAILATLLFLFFRKKSTKKSF